MLQQRSEGAVVRRAGSASGRRTIWIGMIVLAVLAMVGMTGAFLWPAGSDIRPAYGLAAESALPEQLRKAPPKVREAYRFAIANREILRQIPCYCGCGTEHKSNAECYIKDVAPDGKIVFDLMSYG